MRVGRLAAALAAALMIGACGDSGGGSTTSASSTPSTTASTASTPAKGSTQTKTSEASPAKATKAEVVSKGDTACRAAKTKRNRLDRVGTAAEQIARLASQTGDKVIAKYVGVLNNELGLLRRLSYARKHKQSQQEQFLLAALAKQRHRARVLAKQYGFQSCGSG
jgi:ABC-type glycerol-3-phosphate transport system substrate-binding protein